MFEEVNMLVKNVQDGVKWKSQGALCTNLNENARERKKRYRGMT